MLLFQNFQRWIPTLDPQSVNVVVTGKDNCTAGLINILSYDLMARKADILKRKKFQVIIMVCEQTCSDHSQLISLTAIESSEEFHFL